MNRFILSLQAVALSLFVLGTSSAHAAETLSVSGTFSDASGPEGMIVLYCGGTGQSTCEAGDPVQVRWGDPAETERSGLGFDGLSGVAAGPEPFLVGSMTHYNYPIWGGTEADLVTLGIRAVVDTETGDVIFDELLTLQLDIDETQNIDGTCVYPSTIPCADKITLVGGAEGNVFTRRVHNLEYVLNVLGFRKGADGTGEVVDAFISDERQATTANMFASFSRRILVVADAGADQTVNEGQPVALDGTHSGGEGLSYGWTQVDGPGVVLTGANTATPSFAAPAVSHDTSATFELSVTDGEYTSTDRVSVLIANVNDPPVCTSAAPSAAVLWPANHALHEVGISGTTDPDGNPVTIEIVAVYQDEPVRGTGDGDTAPDAFIDQDRVQVRAERSGGGNGRVYAIFFAASDGFESCAGSVQVSVPHDRRRLAIADDFDFDSTQP